MTSAARAQEAVEELADELTHAERLIAFQADLIEALEAEISELRLSLRL